MTRDDWRREHGEQLANVISSVTGVADADRIAIAILNAIEERPEPTVWVDMAATLREIEAERAEFAENQRGGKSEKGPRR